MSILSGFYRQFLQLTPNRYQKWISGYDFPGPEIQDLQQRTHGIIHSQILNLTAAQSPANPMVISVPGVAAVIYGVNSANSYDVVNNTGLEQAEPSAFVGGRINADRPENFFPFKHNRGFVGSFNSLYLSWPAQNNTYARLVIFKYDARPWINGEHDSRFGATVQGTVVTNETPVTLVATTNTLLLPANTKRKVSTIYNTHASSTVYLGATGATTNGILLAAGGIAYWKNTAALYAYSAGTPTLNMITET